MNCNEAKDYLPDLLCQEMEEDRERALRQHLAHCASCAEELEGLQAVRMALQKEPPVRMPQEIRRAILLKAEEHFASPIESRWRIVLKPAFAFSLIGLLAAGILYFMHFTKEKPVPLEFFLAEHTRALSKGALARRTIAAASPYYSLQPLITQ